MHKFFPMIALATALQAAHAEPSFDGKWSVQAAQKGRMSIEVALADGKGTWTFFGGATRSKDDPCVNKRLPAVVQSATDAEVTIAVDGNSVLNGCLTGTLVLHPAADGTWTGVLPGGAPMTWTRQ